MNIIYRHKETGTEYTLDYMRTNQKYLTKFANLPSGRIFTYNLRDIPFSDDFEMIIEDNPYDFDECEIYTLLNALKLYPYATSHELKLKDKLVKIYKKLKGWD